MCVPSTAASSTWMASAAATARACRWDVADTVAALSVWQALRDVA